MPGRMIEAFLCRYSLLHLTGDYPIVKYTFAAKSLSSRLIYASSVLILLSRALVQILQVKTYISVLLQVC